MINNNINKEFLKYTDIALEKLHNLNYENDQIIGFFLRGSQNYNLETNESDIDIICIYFPSKTDLVLYPSYQCKTINLQKDTNDYQCSMIDVRKFLRDLTTPTITNLEVLYTKYKRINPKYDFIYEMLFFMKDQIATYNFKKIFYSTYNFCTHLSNNSKKPIGKRAAIIKYFSELINEYVDSNRHLSFQLSQEIAETCRSLQSITNEEEGERSIKESLSLFDNLIPIIDSFPEDVASSQTYRHLLVGLGMGLLKRYFEGGN